MVGGNIGQSNLRAIGAAANGPTGLGGSRNQNPLQFMNNQQHPGTFNHLAVGKGGTRVVNGGNMLQAVNGNFDQSSLDRVQKPHKQTSSFSGV